MAGLIDTTLREGAQAPVRYLSSEQKAEVVRALARIGIAEIELGRMDWLVQRLEQGYARQNNWDFLQGDTQAWATLLAGRPEGGPPRRMAGPPPRPPGAFPPPGPPPTIQAAGAAPMAPCPLP